MGKEIILSAIGAVLVLGYLSGCRREAAPPPRTTPTSEEEAENIRLQQSSSGGVFILEEGDDAKKKPPAGKEGLDDRRRPPAKYPAFRDQHVTVYVDAVGPALEEAVKLAVSSGAQVINHPIKGFENMGPNERTLLFDYRTFRPYLKKLEAVGKIEHPKVERSEFVTVRLTVLSDQADEKEAEE